MRTIPKKEDLFTEFKSDTKEKNGLPDSELIDAIVGMTNEEGGIRNHSAIARILQTPPTLQLRRTPINQIPI